MNPQDERSLAFRQFSDDRIRKVKHNGVTHYSLIDICAVVADTVDARIYWRDTKRRLEKDGFQTGEKIPKLKMPAPDGKMRLTDCADAETCLRIVQSIPSPKAEPIRQWFTNIGIKHLKNEQHQAQLDQKRTKRYLKEGRDPQYIEERLTGIVARNSFTAEVQAAINSVLGTDDYKRVTNTVYTGILDRTARTLRQEMNLPEGTNVREYLPGMALTYIRIAEEIAAKRLGKSAELSIEDACAIIDEVARAIGQQARETSRLLGVDIATGKPLLGKGA